MDISHNAESDKPPPITLLEPIEVAKFWKGRRRDKAIIVSLSTYEQTDIINVREHFVGADGIMLPTTKGVAMSVNRLPELSAALCKALEKARELGLIEADEKADA
jgi:hypothetical protein